MTIEEENEMRQFWTDYWEEYNKKTERSEDDRIFDVKDLYAVNLVSVHRKGNVFYRYTYEYENKILIVENIGGMWSRDVITGKEYVDLDQTDFSWQYRNYMVKDFDSLKSIFPVCRYSSKITLELLKQMVAELNGINYIDKKNETVKQQNDNKCSFENFIYLFIAVSYIRGKNSFNINNLCSFHNNIFKEDISKYVVKILEKLIKRGILYKDENDINVVYIKDKAPLDELIGNNAKYLENALQGFKSYENYLNLQENKCENESNGFVKKVGTKK